MSQTFNNYPSIWSAYIQATHQGYGGDYVNFANQYFQQLGVLSNNDGITQSSMKMTVSWTEYPPLEPGEVVYDPETQSLLIPEVQIKAPISISIDINLGFNLTSNRNDLLDGIGLGMGSLDYNLGGILHNRAKYDVFTKSGRQLNTPVKTVIIRTPLGNINNVSKSLLNTAGKTLKVGGVVTFGVSTYVTAADTYNYYSNGGTDAAVGIKAGIDTIMGVVGFCGPIGLGISATYFIVNWATKSFGGYGIVP